MTHCSHCFGISFYTNTYTLTCSLTAWMIKRSCLVEHDTRFTLFWYLPLYKYVYNTDLLPDCINDKQELFGEVWHTVHTVLVYVTCSLTESIINWSCLVECDTLFTLFWYLLLHKYVYIDLLPDSVNDKQELFGGVWLSGNSPVHTVWVSFSIQINIHRPAP